MNELRTMDSAKIQKILARWDFSTQDKLKISFELITAYNEGFQAGLDRGTEIAKEIYTRKPELTAEEELLRESMEEDNR
jgi:hypothetical protein